MILLPFTNKWFFKNTQLGTHDPSLEPLSVHFVKNKIYVKGVQLNAEAAIYDLTGKLIEKITPSNGQSLLKNNLAQGNYILNLPEKSIKFMAE